MLFLKDGNRYIYGNIGYEDYKKEKILYLDDVCCMGEIVNNTENEDIGLIVLYILNDLGQFFEGDVIITKIQGDWVNLIFKKRHKEYRFEIEIWHKEYALYFEEIPCFDMAIGSGLLIKSGNLNNLKNFEKEVYDTKEWKVIKGWEERAKRELEEEIKRRNERLIEKQNQSSKMMYYIVYEITDLTNGMKYIGKHKTTNINDGYMGSGRLLKQNQEIKGIENFTKKILHLCKNDKHMAEMEAMEIEKVKAYENNMYYNLKKEK